MNPLVWTVIIAVLSCTGCITGGGPHGGSRYEFELHVGSENRLQAPATRYVVFEEVWHVDEHIDGMPVTRQIRASIREARGSRLSCELPSLRLSPEVCVIPPLVSWWDDQYRFTIYEVGYKAQTIYPETGYSKTRYPGEPSPRAQIATSCPGKLKVSNSLQSRTTTEHNAVALPCERDAAGVVHCSLMLEPSKPVPTEEELETWTYQLNALREAIERGRLRHVAADTRNLLYEAIRSQYDLLWVVHRKLEDSNRQFGSSPLKENKPGMSEDIESSIRTIEKWVNAPPR